MCVYDSLKSVLASYIKTQDSNLVNGISMKRNLKTTSSLCRSHFGSDISRFPLSLLHFAIDSGDHFETENSTTHCFAYNYLTW